MRDYLQNIQEKSQELALNGKSMTIEQNGFSLSLYKNKEVELNMTHEFIFLDESKQIDTLDGVEEILNKLLTN